MMRTAVTSPLHHTVRAGIDRQDQPASPLFTVTGDYRCTVASPCTT